MLSYIEDQKVLNIFNVSIGGQPGENPLVVGGSVFYDKHKALLNERTGKFDKNLVEAEINEFISLVDELGLQAIIDVVGGYPEALVKECEFIADLIEVPFLVDGLNDNIRIPTMMSLKEMGLLERAILNSIDENTSDQNLDILREIGVKHAVLLTFRSNIIYANQKVDLLINKLIPKAEKAGIDNYIVDTAVLDLTSINVNIEISRLIKTKLGIPTGLAPANAIYEWNKLTKYGEGSKCGAIASLMAYCASAGNDFVLFGPVKYAKCVVPSIALISGINSYYRKRFLRKNVSERISFQKIF